MPGALGTGRGRGRGRGRGGGRGGNKNKKEQEELPQHPPVWSRAALEHTPPSSLLLIKLTYLAGARYDLSPKAEILNKIRSSLEVYVGVSALTLGPIFVKADGAREKLNPKVLSGPGSGMKLFDTGSAQQASFLIPSVDLYQEGRVVDTIDTLMSYRAAAPMNNENAQKENNRTCEDLFAGLPLHMPVARGYTGMSKNGTPLAYHPKHGPDGVWATQFRLPVFPMTQDTIPARATDILSTWMANNPRDLLYMQVAV